jgi:hypothetical protein
MRARQILSGQTWEQFITDAELAGSWWGRGHSQKEEHGEMEAQLPHTVKKIDSGLTPFSRFSTILFCHNSQLRFLACSYFQVNWATVFTYSLPHSIHLEKWPWDSPFWVSQSFPLTRHYSQSWKFPFTPETFSSSTPPHGESPCIWELGRALKLKTVEEIVGMGFLRRQPTLNHSPDPRLRVGPGTCEKEWAGV